MRAPLLALLLFIGVLSSCRDHPAPEPQRGGFEALSGPYLGQDPPGSRPRIFMPGLISTNKSQGSITFLDYGRVAIFSEVAEKGHKTYFTRTKDGRWTEPELVPFHFEWEWMDYTSPDGRKLYFQSSRPTRLDDPKRESNTWVVEWSGESWTKPRALPAPPNHDEVNDGYPSATSDGTLYFFSTRRPDSREGDLYRSRLVEGAYQEVDRLEWPINTDYFEADPYIAPDESFLLFGSDRPGTYGTINTFICFREDDGGWTHPVLLGRGLNSTSGEIRIRVTHDGKYFFFYSVRPTDHSKGEAYQSVSTERYGDGDIYWSDTTFIADLKARYVDTKCAASIVERELETGGLPPAIERLKALHSSERDAYHFFPYELLAISEKMLKDGNVRDADAFHQALVETLPETMRLKVGYAVICTLNGRTQHGLTLLEEVASEDSSFNLEDGVYRLSEYSPVHSRKSSELEMLEYAARKFPQSYRAFFHLAEASERYGDREEALANCRKALELKPDSLMAADLLQKLEPQEK